MNQLVKEFILNKLETSRKRPLFIGINGPQGSGKTTLCQSLKSEFQSLGFKVAYLSIDDFYLDFKSQKLLFQTTRNPLLEWRGLPGTHDLLLGTKTLQKLRDGQDVLLPRYDKSLNDGRGDQCPQSQWESCSAVDLVLFEGWCLGFRPSDLTVAESQLTEWNCKVEHLLQINDNLSKYQDWHTFLDAFVLIKPNDINNVFEWKYQQEETLKKEKGKGLTREQVTAFVLRFMPCYYLYSAHLNEFGIFSKDEGSKEEKSLVVEIDVQRNVLNSFNF